MEFHSCSSSTTAPGTPATPFLRRWPHRKQHVRHEKYNFKDQDAPGERQQSEATLIVAAAKTTETIRASVQVGGSPSILLVVTHWHVRTKQLRDDEENGNDELPLPRRLRTGSVRVTPVLVGVVRQDSFVPAIPLLRKDDIEKTKSLESSDITTCHSQW